MLSQLVHERARGSYYPKCCYFITETMNIIFNTINHSYVPNSYIVVNEIQHTTFAKERKIYEVEEESLH